MELAHVILLFFMILPFFLPGVILACTTLMSTGMYTADCTGRNMDEIPLGLPNDIKALDFKNNSLTKLFDNMFKDFKELHHLYLAFNKIRKVEHEAFYGIKNLITLDLEGNRLSSVPYDVFHEFGSLVHLNLNRNPLKIIHDYAFPGLPSLEVLTLEHCQIEHIANRAFLGLNQLKELSLVYNNLQTLNSEIHTTLKSHTLDTLKLWGNPWHCDCNIRWIKVWLKMAQDDILWWIGDKVPTCVTPHRMERREWPNLQIDHFACTPVIGTSSVQVMSYTGSNVSLTCEVYARPKGWAKWYKGTKLLEEQNLYHIVNMYGNDYNFTTTLNLYRVGINDTGQYYCMGSNYAGQSEAKIELLISKRKFKPSVDFIYFDLGTIIGIILAAVIVIALIVISCYLVMLRRDKKKKKKMKKEKQNASSIASDIVYTSNTKGDVFEVDDGPTCTVKIKNTTYYTDPYRFPEDEEEEKTHIFSNQKHRQWQGSLGVHNPTASPSGSDTMRSIRSETNTIRSNRSNPRTNTSEPDTTSCHDKSSASNAMPRSTFRPERPFSSAYPESDYLSHSPVPARSPVESYQSSTYNPKADYNPKTDIGKLNLDDDPYYYGTIV